MSEVLDEVIALLLFLKVVHECHFKDGHEVGVAQTLAGVLRQRFEEVVESLLAVMLLLELALHGLDGGLCELLILGVLVGVRDELISDGLHVLIHLSPSDFPHELLPADQEHFGHGMYNNRLQIAHK